MDIPNLAAAFGKCPRSTKPKEMFLFEYLHQKNHQNVIQYIKNNTYIVLRTS